MSVNKVLKEAKACIDKKDYDGVLKHCQTVLTRDAGNYNAHVFAGLANLQLGNYDAARQHYQRAIETQPDNPLAWKGLADFFDKHRPVIQDEQKDALKTYCKLLSFVESDQSKATNTLLKMAALHEMLSQHPQVLDCYSRVLNMDAELPEISVVTMVTYILGLKDFSEQTWNMLLLAYDQLAQGETKNLWRAKIISRGLKVYKECGNEDLNTRLMVESELLVSSDTQTALVTLVQLTLWEQVSKLLVYNPFGHSIELPRNRALWCQELQSMLSESSLDSVSRGVACSGSALLLAREGKWNDCKSLVEQGITCSANQSELYLLAGIVNLRLHDYKAAAEHCHKGLKKLSSLPKHLMEQMKSKFKQCLLCAAVGVTDAQQIAILSDELYSLSSHDCHVTSLVVKGYLATGNIDQAKKVVSELESLGDNELLVSLLQGQLSIGTESWETAIDQLEHVLKVNPNLSLAHFLHGVSVWRSKVTDKRPAYSSFIQAAKLDPLNGLVFLYLGKYQRDANKDKDRAIKCFQKAVALIPSLTEAAIELGDLLSIKGQNDQAFRVYEKICSEVPPNKAGHAWLRVGLHHHMTGSYNEAIKCFQIHLKNDRENYHCWECLGDSYLSRGSYNSSLKAFTKCQQLRPSSIYPLYQMAGIKQALGQLREACVEYTSVLEADPSYVPALKGRGETNLKLAREALENNLDKNAVDSVARALQDLTCAAQKRPQFVCLWKLIGDCCLCLHQLPSHLIELSIPGVLQGQSTTGGTSVRVSKLEMLNIGVRSYSQALRLSPDSHYCWHDLALGYLYISKETVEEEKKNTQLSTALSSAKKALELSPQNHQYWNTLGLIAASSGIDDVGLAQHCFIKSLQQLNNAEAWSNLGTLYLSQGDIELAHEALMNAQSANPDQVEAWIGQALVAEAIGDSEAMDLLRHSTLLGYHPEGALGYGYWVCQSLHTQPLPGLVDQTLDEATTTAVLQARDSLEKYERREDLNSCALNCLGVLFKLEGLNQLAQRTFRKALTCADDCNKVSIQINLARSLSDSGDYKEAVSVLESLPLDHQLRLQLALTVGRAGDWRQAIKLYEELLCDSAEDKSAVLTAQAMAAFANNNKQSCKTLLFKSFQTPPVCPQGLVAMCALGCLDSDLTLLQAALQEILNLLDGNNRPQLDLTYVNVLKAIALILENHPEAGDCLNSIGIVTQKLPSLDTFTMPSPDPFNLHTLFQDVTEGEAIRVVQKLYHSYPTNKWCVSSLTHINRALCVK